MDTSAGNKDSNFPFLGKTTPTSAIFCLTIAHTISANDLSAPDKSEECEIKSNVVFPDFVVIFILL